MPTTFRTELLATGVSERTATAYGNELRDVERFARAHGGQTLRNITAEVLGDYVRSKPFTWSTRKTTRSALGKWWSIHPRRRPPIWVVRVPRKPSFECRALDELEAVTLDRAARATVADADPASALFVEALAVLVALYVGFRREEISQVRFIDFTNDGWLRVMGKGAKPAEIPVERPELLAAIERRRTVVHGAYVFPGRYPGTHANPATIYNRIRRFAERCGVRDVAPHRLRHTYGATVNDATEDLRAAQMLLRHERPETTVVYTRTRRRAMRKAAQAVDYEKAYTRALAEQEEVA